MRYRRRLLAGAVSCLAILTAVGAASPAAQASPEPASKSLYPPSSLVLTIGYGDHTAFVQRAVTLQCVPPGGDHPAAADACAELAAVDGDFPALATPGGVCTREYRPVTVTAQGVWRGRLTSYQDTFPNPCVLFREMGTVFNF